MIELCFPDPCDERDIIFPILILSVTRPIYFYKIFLSYS